MTSLLDRVGERTDNLLVRREIGDVLEVFGEGLTSNGHARAINETLLDQELNERRSTTDIVQVVEHILARGLEVGQERNPVGDGLEVLNGKLDTDGVGHGDQVKDGVGRTASDVNQNHGVLEGLAGHDILGTNVLLEKLLDRLTSCQTLDVLGLGFGREGRRAREGHTHDLNGTSHSVGSVHTTASTVTRASVTDDIETLGLGNVTSNELAVSLESGDNIDISTTLRGSTSRLNGATVDHQTGAVDPRHAHHDTRHVLIATGDTDVRIVPLTTHNSLDRVGDQITTLQREPHSLSTHANSITDTDSVELESDESGLLYTFTYAVV